MQEVSDFSSTVRALRDELYATQSICHRTRLLLDVVVGCTVIVMHETTVAGKRKARNEVDRIIYAEDESGNSLFLDADRRKIVEALDARLKNVRRFNAALDDCEAESKRGSDTCEGTDDSSLPSSDYGVDSQSEPDPWVKGKDSPWPPPFAESVKPSDYH